MTSKWLRVFGLTCVTVFAIAGCPTDGTGDDGGTDNGGPKAITGTWTGNVDCTLIPTLNGAALPSRTDSSDLTIVFDDSGLPTSLEVISFASGADPVVTIKSAGQSETVDIPVGTSTVTYVITVRSATYTSTSARITLDITYSTSSGAATTSGTGVQTIEATVNGATLTYAADVAYDVTLANPSQNLSFDVDETTDCSGSLAKQ